VPPEQEHRDTAAYQFVAALRGATAAANYPVTTVGETMAAASRADGLENQILALPNYVQVGSPTGDGLYIANPDFDLRYDQSFPLAKLVARAPSGTIDPGFWLLVPGSLGFMGVTQLLGAHSTAVFTATLIAMMSIAVGVQTGLLLWRAAIQLTSSPNRRAMHD
jgi:hypothetical protein